jgi:hypothetical protein
MQQGAGVTETDATDATTEFVGRDAIYKRLQQHVAKPTARGAFLLLGRTGMGKTALLTHFDAYFDDALLGVYLRLDAEMLQDMPTLIITLAAATNALLANYHFNMERLHTLLAPATDARQDNVIEAPAPSDIDNDPRRWLQERYLPLLFRVTRPQRHVIWLLDDAEHLLDAMQNGTLPDDTLHFLFDMLAAFPLLSIVLSLHTRHEQRLPQFAPLVQAANVLRLTRLSAVDAAQLLRLRVPGVLETVCEAVYRVAGGDPRLVLRFGAYLQQIPQDEIYTETVRRGVPQVYAASQDVLRQLWDDLDANERIVLRALAAMHYADPLRSIDSEQIELWLVDTDTPLDLTSINAALRSLEYRELISRGGAAERKRQGGILLTMDLLQRWLLDTTQQGNEADTADAAAGGIGRRGWLLLCAAALMIILLLLLLSQAPATTNTATTPQPTVTLAD